MAQIGSLAFSLVFLQDAPSFGDTWSAFFMAHAAQLGSFFLLLALALSIYSFAVGALALLGRDPASERMGETARRAGISSFFLVLLAAITLVMAAFQDNFSVA